MHAFNPTVTLSIHLPIADGEHACDFLREQSGLEPVLIEAVDSPIATMETYFEDELAAHLLLHVIVREFPSAEGKVTPLEQRDWTTFWQHHFKPIPIGQRMWVAPEWDTSTAPENRDIHVILNPGLSFGTGNHFTTRFCLETLDRIASASRPDSLLDAGCGSGVIAIAAALYGIHRIEAIDFDPVAIEQTRENAARNHVEHRIHASVMDLLDTHPVASFDVVFANLYDELLLRIAPTLCRLATQTLILTGIREFMADAVASTFASLGFHEIARDSDHEWAGMVLATKTLRAGQLGQNVP